MIGPKFGHMMKRSGYFWTPVSIQEFVEIGVVPPLQNRKASGMTQAMSVPEASMFRIIFSNGPAPSFSREGNSSTSGRIQPCRECMKRLVPS